MTTGESIFRVELIETPTGWFNGEKLRRMVPQNKLAVECFKSRIRDRSPRSIAVKSPKFEKVCELEIDHLYTVEGVTGPGEWILTYSSTDTTLLDLLPEEDRGDWYRVSSGSRFTVEFLVEINEDGEVCWRMREDCGDHLLLNPMVDSDQKYLRFGRMSPHTGYPVFMLPA